MHGQGGAMMERSRNGHEGVMLIALGLALFAALVKNAQIASAACREALEMCFRLLIPSLFPFFVLSGFLPLIYIIRYARAYVRS